METKGLVPSETITYHPFLQAVTSSETCHPTHIHLCETDDELEERDVGKVYTDRHKNNNDGVCIPLFSYFFIIFPSLLLFTSALAQGNLIRVAFLFFCVNHA